MRTVLFCLLAVAWIIGPLISRVAAATVPLLDSSGSTAGWNFDSGKEFPGAKGVLTADAAQTHAGQPSLKLSGDFTDGGNYVSAGRTLPKLDVSSLSFWLKDGTAEGLTVRMTDNSGQCHQLRLRIEPTDGWQAVRFPLARFFDKLGTPDAVPGVLRYEHWGGPNDGHWHGPATGIYFIAGKHDPAKMRTLWLSGVEVETAAPTSASAVAYSENFETFDALPAGWQAEGDVHGIDREHFDGARSLRLARDEAHFDAATTATGKSQPFGPGEVELRGALKTDLRSPDASFEAALGLQCLDASGKVLETVRVADVYGAANWQSYGRQATLPVGTTAVRWRVELLKAVGQTWVDGLSVNPAGRGNIAKSVIQRVLLTGTKPGNLLYPGDQATFKATVLTAAPLPSNSGDLRYLVKDYWGAEQRAGGNLSLVAAGMEKEWFRYETQIDLGDEKLEIGKYYELSVEIATGPRTDLYRETTSFAFLPEAVTKKYPWREIPFTSRDWDNRIPDFLVLSDRLGLRVGGLWAGWETKPPYAAHAPNLDLIRKFDMGCLAGTPIHAIETRASGYEGITEEVLRKGVDNLLKTFDPDGRMMIDLGNEPQGTGPTVAANVAAYKIVYDEVKKVSPNTLVVGTSIGPAEEYFKLGFQNACDVVDFHMYEDSRGMESIFKRYDAMFAKYGGRKPIWSTEIGLNSQGLTRRAIASDLIRKFSLFFACGGANISWFDICYPDRERKLAGGSDDSFNVFDGTYALYHPRLDAIAYYNMVNAICIKKFVTRQHYGDMQAFLFRDKDGRALQVWWKERGGQETLVPLPGVKNVQVTRIDGTIATLDADAKGVTLRVSEDPLILQYDGGPDSFPPTLAEPAMEITLLPQEVVRGGRAKINWRVNTGVVGTFSVVLPPGWKKSISEDAALEIEAPADTEARFVPVSIQMHDSLGAMNGDLTVVIPVRGQLSAQLMPTPIAEGKTPGVELILHNNDTRPDHVKWKLSLEQELPVVNGRYSMEVSRPPQAYFTEVNEGESELTQNGKTRITLPLAHVDPLHVYKVRATITDTQGRVTTEERFVGGFVGVPKAKTPPKLDGVLDESDWARCLPVKLDEARQFRTLAKTVGWKGPQDLSGLVRFLWDDQYLYLGIEVTDDVFHNGTPDSALWGGDGVQLLVDPSRAQSDKPGKYDYGMALTPKGPQAWCFLSADGRVPAGEAKDIVVAPHRHDEQTGNMAYEIAIPWSRAVALSAGRRGEPGNSGDPQRGRQAQAREFHDVVRRHPEQGTGTGRRLDPGAVGHFGPTAPASPAEPSAS